MHKHAATMEQGGVLVEVYAHVLLVGHIVIIAILEHIVQLIGAQRAPAVDPPHVVVTKYGAVMVVSGVRN
jgi:hypothetical protein